MYSNTLSLILSSIVILNGLIHFSRALPAYGFSVSIATTFQKCKTKPSMPVLSPTVQQVPIASISIPESSASTVPTSVASPISVPVKTPCLHAEPTISIPTKTDPTLFPSVSSTVITINTPSTNEATSIPTMQQLRSGKTSYSFNPSDKTWTGPSGQVLQEANNQVTIKSSGSPSSILSPVSISPPSSANSPSSSSQSGTVYNYNNWQSSPYAPPTNIEPPKGTDSAANTAKVKQLLAEGLSQVIPNDYAAIAYVLAVATTETSMGQQMPSASDGSQNYKKIGTDSEELGCTRLSRYMVKDLGYTESDISVLKSGSDQSYILSGVLTGKAMQKYTINGFIHFQRGGSTQYKNYLSSSLSSGEIQSANALQTSYRTNQKGNLVFKYVDDNTGKYSVTEISVQSI